MKCELCDKDISNEDFNINDYGLAYCDDCNKESHQCIQCGTDVWASDLVNGNKCCEDCSDDE